MAKKNAYKQEPEKHYYKTCWNIYKPVLKIVKLYKNEKILDAGCGSGELIKYFPSKNLYGIDLYDKALKEALNEGYKEVKQGEIENIQFKDKEFDKSISIEVFQFIENPQKAFKELIRVTKKQIIIVVPNFNWFYFRSLFNKKAKPNYSEQIINQNHTGSYFLRRLGKLNKIKTKIYYVSNNYNFFRNLFGNYLASAVISVYYLK